MRPTAQLLKHALELDPSSVTLLVAGADGGRRCQYGHLAARLHEAPHAGMPSSNPWWSRGSCC